MDLDGLLNRPIRQSPRSPRGRGAAGPEPQFDVKVNISCWKVNKQLARDAKWPQTQDDHKKKLKDDSEKQNCDEETQSDDKQTQTYHKETPNSDNVIHIICSFSFFFFFVSLPIINKVYLTLFFHLWGRGLVASSSMFVNKLYLQSNRCIGIDKFTKLGTIIITYSHVADLLDPLWLWLWMKRDKHSLLLLIRQISPSGWMLPPSTQQK